MYIRQKDGLYAGQVRDFPPHIARELIASGRAVNPFNEIEDAPEERAQAAAAQKKPKGVSARGGSR